MRDELIAIFADLDFKVAEGPDVETDEYNFSKLNIPPEHPARQMHDTFYLKPQPDGTRTLLRTHTNPVQVRTMLAQKPPLRIIAPGRTYRRDYDATHSPMFHQVEGLVVDTETHLGHLKWILEEFCKAYFELPAIRMRLRPSYFPFTEPSVEVDMQCDRSGGQIRMGEGRDWMEIAGAGIGASARAGNVRRRSGTIPGVRIRVWNRSPCDAQIRNSRLKAVHPLNQICAGSVITALPRSMSRLCMRASANEIFWFPG